MIRTPQYSGMRIAGLLQSLVRALGFTWAVVLFVTAASAAQFGDCPGGVCPIPTHNHRGQVAPRRTNSVPAAQQNRVQSNHPTSEVKVELKYGAYSASQKGAVIGNGDGKSAKSLIVTPAHGFASAKGWAVSVIVPSGERLSARKIAESNESEVAFLEVDKSLWSINVDPNDQVQQASSPFGSLRNVRPFSPAELEGTPAGGRAAKEGDSGTPFWNEKGHLVGILLGGRGEPGNSMMQYRLARSSSIIEAVQQSNLASWKWTDQRFVYHQQSNSITGLPELAAAAVAKSANAVAAVVEPIVPTPELPAWYFDQSKTPQQTPIPGYSWTWMQCAKHGRSHWFECSGGGGVVGGTPGPAGPVGPGATVKIGTVETGQPKTAATVTNTGTKSDAIFNFTIPRGVEGKDADPSVIIVAVKEWLTEHMSELKGADGKAATVSVGTVTTVASTSPASVVNTGSELAAVLNFTIPRGTDGTGGEIDYELLVTEIIKKLPPIKVQSYNQVVGTDGRPIGDPVKVDEESYPVGTPLKIRHLIPQPAR